MHDCIELHYGGSKEQIEVFLAQMEVISYASLALNNEVVACDVSLLDRHPRYEIIVLLREKTPGALASSLENYLQIVHCPPCIETDVLLIDRHLVGQVPLADREIKSYSTRTIV